MVARGEFLEHADVFGNYYGTARRVLEEAQQKDHDLLLDIDVQGAAQIQQSLADAVSIFVLPPNRQKLKWRLRNRGTDNPEVIRRRLATARREIENYKKYDYILVNDRLEQSVDEMKAIRAFRTARRSGRPLTDEDQAEICKSRNRIAWKTCGSGSGPSWIPSVTLKTRQPLGDWWENSL